MNTTDIARFNAALSHSRQVTTEAAEALKQAVADRSWSLVIALTSGSINIIVTSIWASAMTCKYGPTGLHQSYCGADGVPTAEALERFPRVKEAMEEAERKINEVYMWQVKPHV